MAASRTDTTKPRYISAASVARLLDGSIAWFRKNRQKLEREGFPKPALDKDDFGGARWDRKAIEFWMDERARIQTPNILQMNAIENKLMNRTQSLKKAMT